MNERELQQLIDGVRSGAVAPDDAVARLRRLPFAEVGDTLVDHHRALRQGMPEAVYGKGKSDQQCIEIVGELLQIISLKQLKGYNTNCLNQKKKY